MTNIIQFDYDIFYNYYSNILNLEENNRNTIVWYYKNTPHPKQQPFYSKLSNTHIIINNTIVYVKQKGSGFLFTIPKKFNNKWWDFHYHFGKRNDFRKMNVKNNSDNDENKTVVYFHKTTQDPENKGKDIKNCYYYPKIEIDMDNFENIQCLQRGNKMSELYTPEDFVYIKEIISRPFLDQKVSTAGKSRKTRRNRKRRIRKTNRFIQKKKNNI
jgi:hypothetical protein